MRINNFVKILQSITKDIKLSFGLSYEEVQSRYLNSAHAIILNWNNLNLYQKYQKDADTEYSYSLYYKFPKKDNIFDKVETITNLLLENSKFLDNDVYKVVDFETVTPLEDSELYIVIQIDLTIR